MTNSGIKNVKSIIDKIESLESRGELEIRLALKLAIMEGGGWIEETMNDIICCRIDRCVKRNVVLKEAAKTMVRSRNYGFKYHDFKEKLLLIINQIDLLRMEEFIERRYEPGLDHFKSILSSIKKERDSKAHIYTKANSSIPSMGFSDLKNNLDELNIVFKIIKSFINRK